MLAHSNARMKGIVVEKYENYASDDSKTAVSEFLVFPFAPKWKYHGIKAATNYGLGVM